MALFSSLKKHGIWSTLREKIQTGNMFYDIGSAALNGTSKTSLELIRLGEINRVSQKIERRYRKLINKPLAKVIDVPSLENLPVWTMWLQGEEQAPALVQRTINSIKKNYKNVEVVTEDNFSDFINLPDEIIAKWHSKVISNAHFSDIVRTELLIKYGGTWIDSTTYVHNRCIWLDQEINNSSLFFFQNMRPGGMGNAIFLSSWFITAIPNEPSLLRLRELLYSYWQENDKLKDYFLFHIFWHLIFKAHPAELRQVPKVPNSLPLQMMYELNNELSDQEIEKIFKDFPIQKLTYKKLSNNSAAVHFKLTNRDF